VDKYPQLADEIRDLFPTIAAMEDWKSLEESHSDRPVSRETFGLERLGDFRIVREIGRGGMGIVYEAEQESLGRRVAVKVLPRQSLPGERQVQRFQREARTAANLHHTNIVPVFGVGRQDDYHYYVMQHIDGASLNRLIDNTPDETQLHIQHARADYTLGPCNRLDDRGRSWLQASHPPFLVSNQRRIQSCHLISN